MVFKISAEGDQMGDYLQDRKGQIDKVLKIMNEVNLVARDINAEVAA